MGCLSRKKPASRRGRAGGCERTRRLGGLCAFGRGPGTSGCRAYAGKRRAIVERLASRLSRRRLAKRRGNISVGGRREGSEVVPVKNEGANPQSLVRNSIVRSE